MPLEWREIAEALFENVSALETCIGLKSSAESFDWFYRDPCAVRIVLGCDL